MTTGYSSLHARSSCLLEISIIHSNDEHGRALLRESLLHQATATTTGNTSSSGKPLPVPQPSPASIPSFQIDISPENDSYQELCTKVVTFQPDVQLHGYALQYVDEENERITFSTNEELRSAIAANKDTNALKIFVVANQPASTSNRESHAGVECDGCHGSVVGARYKCVVCPNFDLCETCSAAGVHSEHNLIKISKPGNLYHPYGPRHHARRHRHGPPSPPASFLPSADFLERIQTQIPQWLPNRETTEHFRTHVQQHLDTLKTSTQSHMQNSKQYLENVGQYLQQTLSPFGIDCEYRVDGQAEASAVPKTSTSTTTTTAAASASSSSTSQEPSERNVEECVEKLKALGFNEINDSMRDLIRAKQGDLNSVLDEINARKS